MTHRLVHVLLLTAAFAPVCVRLYADDDVDEDHFARQARGARAEAEEVRQEFITFTNDVWHLDGFIKDDVPHLAKAIEAQARLLEQAAEAWTRRSEKEAQRLQAEAETAADASEVWHKRIQEWRRRQAGYTPTEEDYVSGLHWVRGNALPQYIDWVRARRAAAQAWGRLAEATVPGADPATLNELHEQAWAADAAREMAEWTYSWTNRREEHWQDKQLTSDAITNAVRALQQLQAERLKLRQADIGRDRRLRELERAMRREDSALQKAVEAAREARERVRENERRR